MWLNHPSYRPLRDELIARFQSGAFLFKRRQRIAFICGAAGSERRTEIETYLRSRRPDTLFFRAEAVWDELNRALPPTARANALAVEERLAELADIVIVIMESAGTFAELGAFSLSNELRKKLLPILDRRYETDRSFINTGPIHWINAESDFKPAIQADFDAIVVSADEVEERLDRIRRPRTEKVEDLASNHQHRLLVLWDLIATIGPVRANHIRYFVDRIFGASFSNELTFGLGLGIALGVIRKAADSGGSELYFRDVTNGVLASSFKRTHKSHFDLSLERARIMSVLQTLQPARDALRVLAGQPC